MIKDVKQPQPAKPSVLALIGGGIGAAIGLGVGRYAGLTLLVPLGFALLMISGLIGIRKGGPVEASASSSHTYQAPVQ